MCLGRPDTSAVILARLSDCFNCATTSAMYCSRAVLRSSSSLATFLYSSGSRYRTDRSSSSHLICHTPRRLASGAKILRVCCAINFCCSTLVPERCRMVWVRSASLIKTTRKSSTIASNILRRLSICCASSTLSLFPCLGISLNCRILEMPTTSIFTLAPKTFSNFSCQSSRYSGTACSMVAAMVS